MQQSINLERFYPHSIDKVWFGLTSRSVLKHWLMENDFEPALGHEFQFFLKSELGQEVIIYCEVITLDPPKQLSYTWREQWMDQPSIVTWTLNSVEDGTWLQLCHSGLDVASPQPLRSPVEIWHSQTCQDAVTIAQPTAGMAAFSIDFGQEWQDRLNQLAEQLLQNPMF
ncbi:SRPBCC domain-containing protein [Nodosilinea sp. LEGE 07298]|uniref:SRPBCC family protein n=1 Tax=Nodosilinea sp. LEGE 07298 TaxID=2777970 RepID=UPI001880F73C|nr:SRPBCC domain-containing protein [Nodosilinea sp. LEGE 07298]MBE9110025.1 SRPBCC domain-containing protein [Nodosilinea sp. LEGE 07298]